MPRKKKLTIEDHIQALLNGTLTTRERIQVLGLAIKLKAVEARIPAEELGSGFDLEEDDDEPEGQS